jgi:hypothetical protein
MQVGDVGTTGMMMMMMIIIMNNNNNNNVLRNKVWYLEVNSTV